MSGCARFVAQPLSPERTAAQFEGRSLADPSLHRYAETYSGHAFPSWPPETWTLESLTFAAFFFNPDLALSRARFETVSAGTITAAERPNPTASIGPVYNISSATPSPWLVTASLDVPIETAGKRRYRRGQAAHASDAAAYAVASAAWDVRARLRNSLLDLWLAERTGSLLQAQQDAQEKLLQLMEAERAVGAITPLEMSKERIVLEQFKLARLDAENRRAQTRNQLASIIGLPNSSLSSVRIGYNSFEQPPAALPQLDARKRALWNRSDLLGALAEYAATESALQLEIARQYPNLHLNPGYEFDQGNDKWGVGLGLDLPILNQNRGPIAEAEARRRESAARFNALQIRVMGEIEVAVAGCQNSNEKHAVASRLLNQAQQQEKNIESTVKAGELPRQAAVAARLETLSMELARLDALFKAQQAAAALENALQLPLELPESLIRAAAQPTPKP